MEQLTYVGPGQLEVREVPASRLQGAEEALVEPVVVASCDLDGPMVRGRTPFVGPFPLGHEGIARVIEVGESVRVFLPGDLVSIPFQFSCGACDRCRLGHTAYCTGHGAHGPAQGVTQMFGIGPTGAEWGGFLSDVVRVPFAEHMLAAVPDDVEAETLASLSDNICDGYRTVAPALAAWPGAAVLVVGSGSVGLYAAALALDAERVDYLDRDPERLRTAERLGADPLDTTDSRPKRLGPYQITVDASNDPQGLQLAVRSTGHEGWCTSSSIYWQPQQLPLLAIYTTGITFKTGLAHARTCMPQVLDLVRSGRLHPELVTGRRVTWQDAAAALFDVDQKLVISRQPAPV